MNAEVGQQNHQPLYRLTYLTYLTYFTDPATLIPNHPLNLLLLYPKTR